MIKIKEITELPAILLDNNHNYVGMVYNNLELNDVCIQIKNQQLEGYYFLFTDSEGVQHTIDIDSNGRIYDKPQEFFGLLSHQLRELLS